MLEQVARASRMLARRVLAAGVCQKLANLTSAHANIERSLIMGDATGRQEFARLSRTAFAWEPVVETARACQSSIERLDELDSEEAQASSASAQDDDERALMDELIAESREVSGQARRARVARRIFVTRARASQVVLGELDSHFEQLAARIEDAQQRSARLRDGGGGVSAVSAGEELVEYDDGCELTELCADLSALLREPTAKCKHRWVCLRGRVHNKGDGKGKYHAFVCTLCGKFQRRYLN